MERPCQARLSFHDTSAARRSCSNPRPALNDSATAQLFQADNAAADGNRNRFSAVVDPDFREDVLHVPCAVSSLMCNSAATSLFRMPRATRCRTPTSRCVNDGWNMRSVSLRHFRWYGAAAGAHLADHCHHFFGGRIFVAGLGPPGRVTIAFSEMRSGLSGRQARVPAQKDGRESNASSRRNL